MPRGKMAKDRLTRALAVNITGTKKLQPIVIGKPRVKKL